MKPDNNNNKYWYPLYTKPRHEKKAYNNLLIEGFEAYLPMQKATKKWSDRKKTVNEPLIKSYVFARIKRHELYSVISLNGISRYISFNNKPAIVRDSEIDSLKKLIDAETKIEVTEGMIKPGKRIKLSSGPMAGFEGEIIEAKGKNKLLLRLESIGKTLFVTVETEKLTDMKSENQS